MSLLFSVLDRIPAVRRLSAERDALRSERDSMRLKVRAASAEMGTLEEQGRVSQGERNRLAEQVAQQARQLEAALATTEALTKERDELAEERDALAAQRDAAAERERAARSGDGPNPGEQARQAVAQAETGEAAGAERLEAAGKADPAATEAAEQEAAEAPDGRGLSR